MSFKLINQTLVIGIIIVMVTFLFGFGLIDSRPNSTPSPIVLNLKTNYWNEGLAEISRYSLSQNRYQDIHPGEVVTIFVKEDFLTDKQVKNESYSSSQSTPVLKNITTKKFTTGLYDYVMSTSVFSPFDQKEYPGSLKVQSTSTEWCGTSYIQLNHRQNAYHVELRSYFEKEGDQNYKMNDVLLEDEIMNLIRFDPLSMPSGKVNIIPMASYCRLTHLQMDDVQAMISHETYEGDEFKGKDTRVLQINFPTLKRNKNIYYESTYPHVILGWDDTYPSAFDKKLRTTKSRLTHQVREAYWNKNKANDADKRKSLGLSTYDGK
jgi:hypothetical protein